MTFILGNLSIKMLEFSCAMKLYKKKKRPISCAMLGQWVWWVEPNRNPPHVVTGAFNAHVGMITPNLQPLYYVAKDPCYWVGKSKYPPTN